MNTTTTSIDLITNPNGHTIRLYSSNWTIEKIYQDYKYRTTYLPSIPVEVYFSDKKPVTAQKFRDFLRLDAIYKFLLNNKKTNVQFVYDKKKAPFTLKFDSMENLMEFLDKDEFFSEFEITYLYDVEYVYDDKSYVIKYGLFKAHTE